MDLCTICHEDVGAATGCATLSCGHPFHLLCIFTWFATQVGITSEQSCPCCRKTAGEKECLPPLPSLFESEAEADSVAGNELGTISIWSRRPNGGWLRITRPRRYSDVSQPAYPEEMIAEWGNDSPEPPPDSLVLQTSAAAKKIQAVARGWLTRRRLSV